MSQGDELYELGWRKEFTFFIQMLKIILLRMGGMARVALCWCPLSSLLKYFNQCLMNGRRRAGPAQGGVPCNLADKCKMAKLFLIKLD